MRERMKLGDFARPLEWHDTLSFGKHAGRTIEWIFDNDPSYLTWMQDEIEGIEFCEEIQDCLTDVDDDDEWLPW